MTIGKHATIVTHQDGYTICVYHQTTVAKINEKHIVLNSGGFETVTTKRRINQCLADWNAPYRVYQEAFQWYVYHVDTKQRTVFTDGMVLPLK